MIAGCQIKNSDNKFIGRRSTKDFRVSGSLNKEGPWEILVKDQLINSRSETVQLLNFRGRAEKEPRISIPVPAVPVSELLAGKSQRICNSLN